MSETPQIRSQQDDEYRPLFNRTYLMVLAWGSIIVIVLLSALDDSKPALYPFTHHKPLNIYSLTTPSDTLSLTLLLPLPTANTEEQKIHREIYSHLINQRLSQVALNPSYSTQTNLLSDTLEISLHAGTATWLSETSLLTNDHSKFSDLYDTLCTPFSVSDIAEPLNTLTARALVNRSTNAKILKQRFVNTLFDHHQSVSVDAIQADSCAAPSLVFYGAEADTLSSALMTQLNQTSPPLAVALKNTRQTLNAPRPTLVQQIYADRSQQRLSGDQWVMGQSIINRADPAFLSHKASATLASQHLKQTYPNLAFGLNWHSGEYHNYFMWSFETPPTDTQAILNQALSMISTEDLEAKLSPLKKHWLATLNTADGQFELVKQIARYNLDENSFNNHHTAVADVSVEAVMPLIKRYLSPSANLQVSFE